MPPECVCVCSPVRALYGRQYPCSLHEHLSHVLLTVCVARLQPLSYQRSFRHVVWPALPGGILPCPVLAVGTVGDDRLRAGQLEAWRRHVERAEQHHVRWFKSTHPAWSNPHRHIVDDAPVMQDLLYQQLEALLQHKPMPFRGPRLAREVDPPMPPGDQLQ